MKPNNCVQFQNRTYSRWKDIQGMQDFLNTLYSLNLNTLYTLYSLINLKQIAQIDRYTGVILRVFWSTNSFQWTYT